MIQVFLGYNCPCCGQWTTEHDHILWKFRNLPQYKDNYDSSVLFNIDIIQDNAEAAAIVALCHKYNLDYHVWEQEDFDEYGALYNEFIQDFFFSDEAEVEWLMFLIEQMFKALGGWRHEVLP
jgi:hypothetical protein